MLTRRDFLARSLKASTLLACARRCRNSSPPPPAPPSGTRTAPCSSSSKWAAAMTGLIPSSRTPTTSTTRPGRHCGMTKRNVLKVNDHIGLHNGIERPATTAQRGPARDRPGRRLSESGPVAFRVDGHLAKRRPEPGRRRPAGSAGRCRRCTTRKAASRPSSSGPDRLPLAPPRCRRRRRQPESAGAVSTRPRRPTTAAVPHDGS